MSKKAEQLFQKMQRTKAGWGQSDFRTLYRGFGFDEEEGGNYRGYTHPQYPFLAATVARYNQLARGYADTAVKLIKRLKELQAETPGA